MDDMHKAYVGRSRTRKADHTLIVQPYSPHLFRQGQLPGPTILMDMLTEEISTSDAMKLWEREKAKKKQEKEPSNNWMQTMTALPRL